MHVNNDWLRPDAFTRCSIASIQKHTFDAFLYTLRLPANMKLDYQLVSHIILRCVVLSLVLEKDKKRDQQEQEMRVHTSSTVHYSTAAVIDHFSAVQRLRWSVVMNLQALFVAYLPKGQQLQEY